MVPIGRILPAELKAYRSTAATTGSSGSFVVLGWDAESTSPSKRGLTHSTSSNTDIITITRDGVYSVEGAITLNSGTWDMFQISVEVNTIQKAVYTIGAASGLLGLTSNSTTGGIKCTFPLSKDNQLRIRVSSSGQSNVSITTGETVTWLHVREIR